MNPVVRIAYYDATYYNYWHVRWLRFWTELGWAYEADQRRGKVQHDPWLVTPEQYDAIVEMIKNPPAPSEKLKALFRRHK